MNIEQIKQNITEIIPNISRDEFIYEFLAAYGLPKASITRLKKGSLNLSKKEGEISWKKKLLFREVFDEDLHVAVSNLHQQVKHNQRFVVVTDYKTLLAIDTKTEDKLDIELQDLDKHFDFFLPWAGMEKAQYQSENPVDVKAAERMAKLYDEIIKDNPSKDPEFIHQLNVFLSRLLFCFFAEDTNIFQEKLFSYSVKSHTQEDGSDLQSYLRKLFEVLNTPESDRKGLPAYLTAFPYVNGGLFEEDVPLPTFSRSSRKAILEGGSLDWSEIHPDIFGSMIQAVISPEHRGGLGMHYTSVPNIMKVIRPLFLDDLYEELEKARGNIKKLDTLLERIRDIKIFDPACGSGNFLIIAYKELRKLEMEILKESGKLHFSQISLGNFYGIELDDFAHEIARLSLWLAEHQMNVQFFNQFGQTNPTLPLKEAGKITHGNALRLDWNEICPSGRDIEVYMLGNPPYLGGKLQSKYQKEDLSRITSNIIENSKNLDYISCWFIKASQYIQGKNSCGFAFVTTNSICQGEQVPLLWPYIFDLDLEIFFAHPSFKWTNNAKSQAAVIVSIIGLRNVSKEPKYLYKDELRFEVQNINGYLKPGPNVSISKSRIPISNFEPMVFGSMARDGGHLLLSETEKNELLSNFPESKEFIKRIYGSKEFLRGENRFCIWVNDDEASVNKALSIPGLCDRFLEVKKFREESKAPSTQAYSKKPYRFVQISFKESNSLIIPKVSSERRDYIPIGFLEKGIVTSDLAFAIYDAHISMLGILSSRMHMNWVKLVAGRLKTDFRYSNSICYNTFPFPHITEKQKENLVKCTFQILEEREKYPEKTPAQLYDPDKMPEGLREAHGLNDIAVDKCYRDRPFKSDEERLEHLFKLYEEMIAAE